MKSNLVINYQNIENKISQSIKNNNWGFILEELPLGSILVGGYIRDLILENNNNLYDIDIVVPDNALDICKKISEKYNGRFIVLDEIRNVGRIIFQEFVIDIASRVGDTIIQDLESRDLTINSIGFHLHQKKIIDPLSGLNDLSQYKLNCPNKNNLINDPLRILRCLRFYAEYNFEIDLNLIIFIKENKALLREVSVERIIYELRKIFRGKRALKALLLINKIELFDWLQKYENLSFENITDVDFNYFKKTEVERFLPLYYLSEALEQVAIKKLKFSKFEISSSKSIKKWRTKLMNKSIIKFSDYERFELHLEMENILPAFIFYLPTEYQNDWLIRWRNQDDKLFHPCNLVNGNNLKSHLKLNDGPILGHLLKYLSKEYAYERITNFDEAIYEAKQWIQQNAPKYD